MAVILIILLVLFLVLIGWMWNSLGTIEKSTKIKCIVGGLVILYIFTFIIYTISSIGLNYEDKSAMQILQNVFVILFTIVNGYLILPFTFNRLDKIKTKEIDKAKISKSIFILVIAIIVLGFLEIRYFGSLQHRILQMK